MLRETSILRFPMDTCPIEHFMHILATTTEPLLSGTLPWIIAALIVGLVLWATGGWVLRSAVGAMGLGLGGLLGMIIWEQTHIGPPWAAPVVGGIVVACVALLAYKLLAAALLTISLAILGGSVAWTVLHLTEAEVPPPPVAGLFGLPMNDVTPEITSTETVSHPSTRSFLPVSLHQDLQQQALELAHHEKLVPFRVAWESLPPDPRLTVLAAAGIAALVGLILSTFFTTAAAVLLTATAGAGLVLTALPRLLDHWNIAPEWLGQSTAGSAIVLAWLSATVVGLVLQGLTRPRLSKAPPAAKAQ
jgi:hypothetical protein